MLMALLPLTGFAAALVGSTQYAENGFKYVIKTMNTTTGDYTVSVSQNYYATKGAAALVIAPTVDITVQGEDVNGDDVNGIYTFKIVEIEEDAFANLTKIVSAQIGENVAKIGASAFDGCTNMATINFDANNNDVDIDANAFEGTKFAVLDLTTLSKMTAVKQWFGAYVAETATNEFLTTVKFPGSLTSIVANAFAGCTKLKDVEFPANTLAAATTLTINAGAFAETAIVDLDLTEAKIVTLNKLFEDDNVKLKTVKMPKSDKFTTLAANALANCIQLNSVDFTKSGKLATLNNGCLSNTVIKTLDFSANTELTAIATTPFVNAVTTTNKNLQTVILPLFTKGAKAGTSPITAIGKAFANCEKLATITNLEVSGLLSVVDDAFENCKSLASLTFPKSVATVDGTPFVGCIALESLTFKGNTSVEIGNAGGDAIFGTTLDALKTLVIEGDYDGTIKAGALANVIALNTIKISEGKEFSGEIEAGAIALAEDQNATVVFGDVTGAVNTIAGPKGIYKTTLTIGGFDAAAAYTDPMVSRTIDVATVGGEVDEKTILTALGQAEKIIFNDDINVAIDAPAVANLVLNAVEFNGLLADGATIDIIPATAFDETNAPILTSVKFVPAATDAPTAKIFNQKAFGSASVGASAKVVLTTTAAVAGLYNADEAELFNVVFRYETPAPEAKELKVYGTASATYYYGKLAVDNTKAYAFPKETENGEQVIVYSAFVDTKDNKIYMDPLAIDNGMYIATGNAPLADRTQAIIVRMKNPTEPTAQTTGFYATLKYSELDPAVANTMRYNQTGTIVNDLWNSTKLYSSDYIGTTFVGKKLWAMANPAAEGTLVWKPVSFDSYLPKNSVFVVGDESVAASELDVVWLDGNEDVTGIIENIAEKNNNETIYNLQGVRVNAAQKGLYIRNGKKFIIK